MIATVEELLELLYQKGKRRDIVSIESTAYAHEAGTAMKENGINLIAVSQHGKYLGVVSTSDTSGELSGSALRPSERRVFDIMSKNIVTVGLDDKLMDIPKTLTLNNIRHLIVVDQKKNWKAVLSTNEVLAAVMANINEEELREQQLKGEFRQ